MENILRIILEKLSGVDFAFIGSANLRVQGLDVSPRDIDILTTAEGIKEIDAALRQYRTKEIYFDETEGRNSFRSFYDVDGKEVEVLGNVNNVYRPADSLSRKIYVEFRGLRLPCIPLADELEVYRKMGRDDKVKLIEGRISASGEAGAS